MAETKVRVVEKQTAEDACCDPECGPDTCGPSVQVIAAEAPMVEEKPPQVAEQCCDPECGPDTCG